MEEYLNYHKISRNDWQSLYENSIPPLTEEELNEIKSLNDSISLKDVQEVYVPLVHLIRIYHKAQESLTMSKGLFLRKLLPTPPFILGISGSVAVGKSTTARLLQILLSRTFKRLHVELITTDGFLYPTDYLLERDMLQRKGFPESYDMERLIRFLSEVKSGKEEVSSPVYSHEIYDIVKGEENITNRPDILIVEGINVLQLPQNQRIYVSDFFDFSIYVDASEENIKKWYKERFEALLDSAFQDSTNYYYAFAQLPRKQALEEADKVWNKINKVNLEQYILPTRQRADVILHKNDGHELDTIYLRKY
ncbi:pantothenate kinase [Pilibacter termitis]|uniref:Pantothenate kinase n=1 Tax=Pilibacter termitis TaxID=263852 RepID=A0A1T4PZE1_9ENTE|nr:type I pantothenate kinase [Pilibacter termitis]SJZ96883.1 pantothenate kinase [Pilibacter termitis]